MHLPCAWKISLNSKMIVLSPYGASVPCNTFPSKAESSPPSKIIRTCLLSLRQIKLISVSSDPSSESFFYCLPPPDIVSLVEDLSKRALLFILRTLFYFPWVSLWVSLSLWEVRNFLWSEVVRTKGRCRVRFWFWWDPGEEKLLVSLCRESLARHWHQGIVGKTKVKILTLLISPEIRWQEKESGFVLAKVLHGPCLALPIIAKT